MRRRENLIMALGYRRVDRDQQFLLPPDMRAWLPESHLVWFVIETVDQLDTSGFHERSVLGGVGRAGFDPGMLVMLLVYGYARGVRSARQIARLCEVDVAFRVICAQDAPEHSTISRFRAAHEEAFIRLFAQVLGLAARAGWAASARSRWMGSRWRRMLRLMRIGMRGGCGSRRDGWWWRRRRWMLLRMWSSGMRGAMSCRRS